MKTIGFLQRITPFLVSALLAVYPCSAQRQPTQTFDLVITNGHIVDGTGSPWYSGDLGIRGGRIAAIGNLADWRPEPAPLMLAAKW